MFKLIKIIGARTNVPEPTYVHIDGKNQYTAGSFYFFSQGKVENYPTNEDDLKFIPLESVPENSGKTKLLGYFVTEGMIFETDIYKDYTAVNVGDTIIAHLDSEDSLSGVEAEDGSDAKLISKDEAATRKKVLVALKW